MTVVIAIRCLRSLSHTPDNIEIDHLTEIDIYGYTSFMIRSDDIQRSNVLID